MDRNADLAFIVLVLVVPCYAYVLITQLVEAAASAVVLMREAFNFGRRNSPSPVPSRASLLVRMLHRLGSEGFSAKHGPAVSSECAVECAAEWSKE